MLRIEFNGNKPAYNLGDNVAGSMLVTCARDINVNEIRANFRGRSHTGWYDYGRRTYFQKNEEYVNDTALLWTRNQLATGSRLSVGSHRFSFSFQIPPDAPCSFKGVVGWIRYAVTLTVAVPRCCNKVKKVFIIVSPKLDLNREIRAKTRPEYELKKSVGFQSSKCIRVHASCNKGGYVPGEDIELTLNITNDSDKDIYSVTVDLEQKATFYGSACGDCCGSKKVIKITAGRLNEPLEVKSKRLRTWQQRVRVPHLPPSDLPGCSIINLEYRLAIKLVCGFLSSVKIQVPFLIGTVPLSSSGFADSQPSFAGSMFG